jgi:hypothetical protein
VEEITIRPARSLDMQAVLDIEHLNWTFEDPDFGTLLSPLAWSMKDFTEAIELDGMVLYVVGDGDYDALYFLAGLARGHELFVARWAAHLQLDWHPFALAALDWLLARSRQEDVRRLSLVCPDSSLFSSQHGLLKDLGFRSQLLHSHYEEGEDAIEFFRTAPFPLSFSPALSR